MEVIFIVLLVLYLIPSYIAWFRNAEHKTAILFINFFLGWTFIIWFVCLVWAFLSPSKNKKSEARQVTIVQNQVSIACGNCSEIIKTGDTFCSKCGEKLQVTIIDNNENIETNNDKEDRWEFGTETVEEIYKPYNFSDDLRKLSSLYQRIPSYIKVAFLILIISIVLLFFLFPYIWGDFIIIWVQDRLNCYSKFNCDVYYLGENSDFLVRFIFSLFWLFIGISALVIINSFIFIIYTSFVPIKDSFKKRFATTLQNKISYYIFLSILIAFVTAFLNLVIITPILFEFSNFDGIINLPVDYISIFVLVPHQYISYGILILFPPIFLYRFQKTLS